MLFFEVKALAGEQAVEELVKDALAEKEALVAQAEPVPTFAQ